MIKPTTPTNRNEKSLEISIHTTSTRTTIHLYKPGPIKGTWEKPKSLHGEEKTLNQLQPTAMVLRTNSICSKTFDLQDNSTDNYQRITTKEVNIQEFWFKRLLLAPPDNWHLESRWGLFHAPPPKAPILWNSNIKPWKSGILPQAASFFVYFTKKFPLFQTRPIILNHCTRHNGNIIHYVHRTCLAKQEFRGLVLTELRWL